MHTTLGDDYIELGSIFINRETRDSISLLRQLLFVPLEKTTIVVIHALCTMHCSVIALKHVLYMQFS